MNDKDKLAFEKWMAFEDRHDGVFGNNNNFTRDSWIAEKTWQAACEYRQTEIDELLAENAKLRPIVNCLAAAEATAVGATQIYINCARQVLKELEEK